MELTEIRVKLVDDRDEGKLLAFCTITFDNEFVVRDLKIIKGDNGPFVAMPSRKLTDHCPGCRAKNHLRARFCNECGRQLNPARAGKDDRGRHKLHTDIAHPINAESRTRIQRGILQAYQDEKARSQLPGYVPPRLGDDYDEPEGQEAAEAPAPDRGPGLRPGGRESRTAREPGKEREREA